MGDNEQSKPNDNLTAVSFLAYLKNFSNFLFSLILKALKSVPLWTINHNNQIHKHIGSIDLTFSSYIDHFLSPFRHKGKTKPTACDGKAKIEI